MLSNFQKYEILSNHLTEIFHLRCQKAIYNEERAFHSKRNYLEKKKTLSFITVTCSLFASVFVSRPTGLRTSNVTLTSIRVEWNPVPERYILGYRVFVPNISFNETLPWNKTSVNVVGLCSNTKYIIRVLPVHGLTDEEHPAGNAESIVVSTKREPGKTFLRVSNSPNWPKCSRKAKLTEITTLSFDLA